MLDEAILTLLPPGSSTQACRSDRPQAWRPVADPGV